MVWGVGGIAQQVTPVSLASYRAEAELLANATQAVTCAQCHLLLSQPPQPVHTRALMGPLPIPQTLPCCCSHLDSWTIATASTWSPPIHPVRSSHNDPPAWGKALPLDPLFLSLTGQTLTASQVHRPHSLQPSGSLL